MGLSVETWSCGNYPRQRQIHAYQDYLARSNIYWDISWAAGDHYLSSSVHRYSDSIIFFEVEADQISGEFNRAPRQNNGLTSGFLALTYMQEGCLNFRQDLEELELDRGSITLWDTSRSGLYACQGHVHHLTLLIPRDLFLLSLPSAAQLVGTSILVSDGLGLLLGNHLRTLHSVLPTLSVHQHRPLVRATLELFAATFRPHCPPGQSGTHLALVRQAQDYIAANLCDPDLSAERVAVAVGVSESHLYRIFRSAGVSVGDYMRSRRLSASKQALRQPGRNMTITEIALHFGFYDASHFSRTFRAEFGLTPSDFRKYGDYRHSERQRPAQPCKLGRPIE